MRISFLGGTGTVTGSKYLVEAGNKLVLVDCGLFQGRKELRLRNWKPLPVRPADIDVVLLTHAHLDHSGYLPILVRDGFRGQILCTAATRDLCGVILPDSGRIQEEDATHANRHGYSRHLPARPLYTEADAVRSLSQITEVKLGMQMPIDRGIMATFRSAGHILGAATIELEADGSRLLFSGDLGRRADPLVHPPAPIGAADFVVVESTYGNRRHSDADYREQLADVITRTARRGGAIVIPAFAVARAQILIWEIDQLRRNGKIPDLPVFLDSPMAQRATDVFLRHIAELKVSAQSFRKAFDTVHVTDSVAESRRLDGMHYPRIIVSASGMATGGRVLHHLKALAPDPRTSILLVGFQAAGTRGADMQAGARAIRIHGSEVPVRAEVVNFDGFSAHADYEEILTWLGTLTTAPVEVFVTHGEPESADAVRRGIGHVFGWRCRVPQHLERVTLSRVTAAVTRTI